MRSDTEIKNLIKAIDSLENQLLVVSRDLEILAANAAARRLIGDDCIGKHCFDVFCQEDAPCDSCSVQNLFKARREEFSDGSAAVDPASAPACGQIFPIDSDDNMEAAVCIDIEPQKPAEPSGSGQLANAFLKTLIHSSPDAVIITGPQGDVLLINEAARLLSGYSEKEIYSEINIRDMYPDDKAYDVMARLRSEHYGGPGKLKAHHLDVLNKQGQKIPIRLDAAIVYDGNKEIATLGYFRDLRYEARGSSAVRKDGREPTPVTDGTNLETIAASVARRLNLYNKQFGRTAVKIGLIDEQQLDSALAHQQQLHEKTQIAVPLGRVLVKLDYITEEQRTAILAVKALSEEDRPGRPGRALADEAVLLAKELEIYNRRFGDLALKLGFISEDQLARSLQMQKQVGAKTKIDIPLGRVLEQLEYITEEQRAAVLAIQALGEDVQSEHVVTAIELEVAESAGGTASLEEKTSEPEAEAPEAEAAEPETGTAAAEAETAELESEAGAVKTEAAEPEAETAEVAAEAAELETETVAAEAEAEAAEPEIEAAAAEAEKAEPETEAAELGPDTTTADTLEKETDVPENRIREYFSVDISEDKLTARLIPKSREREDVVFTDLMDLIEAEGVRQGLIAEDTLKAFFADESDAAEPLVIARGYPPGEGRAPEVVYHFETDYLQAGKMLEDGTIDWKDRGEIP